MHVNIITFCSPSCGSIPRTTSTIRATCLNLTKPSVTIMTVDYAQDVILVTCASGKQAGFLLPFLVAKWKNLRLMVSSEASRQKLEQAYPKAEVIQADLTEPKDCRNIMNGVTAVYHIGPPLHPHETEIGYNMIDAAAAQTGSTFKQFVLSSVLNTQLRKLMNHDCKRYVVGAIE